MRRNAVLLFVAVFFGGQLALVAWSYVRGDRLGGYQMFAESTFFEARLHRRMADGRREYAPRGAWVAKDEGGRTRHFRWGSYVDDFKLDYLDTNTRAKIGIDATLKFFQHALDDVADRIDGDGETVRLELDIAWVTASGKRASTRLESHERRVPRASEPAPEAATP